MSVEYDHHTPAPEIPKSTEKMKLVMGPLGLYGSVLVPNPESEKLHQSGQKEYPSSNWEIQRQKARPKQGLLERITAVIIPEGISVFGQKFEFTPPTDKKYNPQNH